MFSPTIMAAVAREQHRDHLKEAETARLLQPANDTPQLQGKASSHLPFDHLLGTITGYLRKHPGRA